MIDRKTIAADPEESRIEQERCLAFAEEVLDALLRFTSLPPETAKLHREDREEAALWRRDWIQRLSKVPAWKLGELSNFTGQWINDVWAFFDTLKQPPSRHEILGLPEPEQNIGLVKECLKYIKIVTSDKLSKEQRKGIRERFNTKMKQKYPQYTWR